MALSKQEVTRRRMPVLLAVATFLASAGIAIGLPQTDDGPVVTRTLYARPFDTSRIQWKRSAHGAAELPGAPHAQPAAARNVDPVKPERARRVIMIVVDTLRPDHLSAYGYQRPTSPALTRLAREEAVRFDRTYSASSWTLPSVTSMFTSLYPNEHGVEDRGNRLASDVPTLAAAFSAQGWHSAAFVTHIYASSLFGLDSGFEEFHELAIDQNFGEGHQIRAEELNARVLPWLDAHADEPFFLYLHYFDPHWDYDPPPPYDTAFTSPDYDGPATGRWSFLRRFVPTDVRMSARDLRRVEALYDGEIRYTDAQLAALFEHLRSRGLWDDSAVVVVSDHGEEFQEHGSMHHIRTLYEEVVRVPLIIKPAGGRPAAWRREVGEVVRTIDVAPTLLELAGLNAPASFRGESLVDLMRTPGQDREAFARTIRHASYTAAVVRGRYKVIRRFDVEDQPARLYDLAADPGEHSPQIEDASGSELARHLASYLALARVGSRQTTPVVLTAPQIERLETLGYMQ